MQAQHENHVIQGTILSNKQDLDETRFQPNQTRDAGAALLARENHAVNEVQELKRECDRMNQIASDYTAGQAKLLADTDLLLQVKDDKVKGLEDENQRINLQLRELATAGSSMSAAHVLADNEKDRLKTEVENLTQGTARLQESHTYTLNENNELRTIAKSFQDKCENYEKEIGDLKHRVDAVQLECKEASLDAERAGTERDLALNRAKKFDV